MREQKANDNGFPVVGKQAKEQQIFPFEQLVEYDGATNKITINANLTINGDTNIDELDIDSGDAPKGQVLTADGESGARWGFPSMERIVDHNGNFRFVEGNITLNSNITAATLKFGKWSLSGSHLMIVLAFANETENNITIKDYTALSNTFELPAWVLAKIFPIASNVVSQESGHIVNPNSAAEVKANKANYLVKRATSLHIATSEKITLESNEAYRVCFDILIDTE